MGLMIGVAIATMLFSVVLALFGDSKLFRRGLDPVEEFTASRGMTSGRDAEGNPTMTGRFDGVAFHLSRTRRPGDGRRPSGLTLHAQARTARPPSFVVAPGAPPPEGFAQIPTGDAAFDARYRVFARAAGGATGWLTAERRASLLAAKGVARLAVNDLAIRIDLATPVRDRAALDGAFVVLMSVCRDEEAAR